MMKNFLLKRGLALLLALIMCTGMLPASALAAGNPGNEPAVSQLAHKHSWGKWTVTKKATCTEKGEQKRTCSVCGKTETQEIKKTGHKFGKWVVTKEATCSDKGLRSHTCTVCNKVVTEEIPTIPHIYQKWKLTEPDGTWEEYDPNDKLEETDADGFTKDGKKISITEWKVIKPASCSEKGEKIRVCTVCGEVEKKEIKKTDHSFSEWEVTEAASCSKNGEMVRVCTACGKTEKKEIKKTGHSFGEWQVTKPASCTEKGEQVRICAVCGHTETEEIKKTEHSFGTWELKEEASCFKEGTEERICSGCGKIETKSIPVIPHTFGDWTVTKEPTCADEGKQERKCTVCGKTETEAIPVIEHSFGEWEVTSEPTCTEKGKQERVCTVCGEKEKKTIPVIDHSFGEWEVTKEPTCTEKGKRERVCTVCGEKEKETIPVVEHSFGEWKVTKKATCTEKGKQERVCTVCGEKEKEAIPATGHVFGEDWVCVICGAVSEDKPKEKNITIVYTVSKGGKVSIPSETVNVLADKVKAKGAVAEKAVDDWYFKNWTDAGGKVVSEELKFVPDVGKDSKDLSFTANYVYMPASGAAVNAGGATVSYSYGAGTFPESTDISVNSLSTEKAIAFAAKATGSDIADAVAFDITFYHDGKAVQPANGNSVRISMSFRKLEGTNPVLVYEGMDRKNGISASATNSSAEFYATHFSIYAVATEGIKRTYRFYNKAQNEVISEQEVSKNDTLTDPGIPALEAGEEFLGWILKTGPQTAAPKTIDDLNAELASSNFTENETLEYVPVVDAPIETTITVVYDVGDGTGTIPERTYKAGDTAVAAAAPNAPENMKFMYWVYGDGNEKKVKAGSEFQVNTEDADNANIIRMLAFYGSDQTTITFDGNAKDASVNGQEKITFTVAVDQPVDVPKAETVIREGYIFSGWNTEPDGSGKSFAPDTARVAANNLSEEGNTDNNTLYAQWKLPITVTVKCGVKLDGKEITDNKREVIYDGKEHRIDGYIVTAVDAEGVSVGNYSGTDVSITKKVSAKGTDAGAYSMGITPEHCVNLNKNYDVTFVVEDGVLVIAPLEVTVTVTGKTAKQNYNGKEYKLTGYETEVSDKLYTEADFTFSGKAEVKGTNAGTYAMGLKTGQFSNDNKNFAVTFKVEDGKLVIDPLGITVTITGKTAEQDYDGKEHKLTGYEVKISDKLYKEADFTFSGKAEVKGTNAGTYAMGLKAAQFRNDNKNFAVTFKVNDGKLVIIQPKTIIITVNGHTGVKTYNGSYQYVEGYDVVKVEGAPKGTEASISKQVMLKDGYKANTGGWRAVGTYSMNLTSGHFKPVTVSGYNVIILVNDGYIVINPAPVTVTAENITKNIGDEDPVFTARVSGLIGNDTVSYELKRQSGEDSGTYRITPTGDIRQGQYTVTYISGTLTIVDSAPSADKAETGPAEDPGSEAAAEPTMIPISPTPVVVDVTDKEPQQEESDKAESKQTWSLLNLILGLITTLAGALTGLSILEENGGRSSETAEDTRSRKWPRLLAVVPALAAIITFILTEDMGGLMVIADKWTILMIVYGIIGGVIAYFTRGKKTV